MDNGSVSLMGSKNQDFCNLHMLRSTGCIESHIRNIIPIQRFDTLINTPWKRTLEKFVSTKPGLTLVTRTLV